MAITLTTLLGTDSIAANRITINDNFSTLRSALNSVLSIIDISTGAIDNSSFGSSNTITTQGITINGSGGVSVTTGSIAVSTGNVTLGGYIEFGLSSGVKISKESKTYGGGTLSTLSVSGTAGLTGSGAIGYFTVPRMTTTNIKSIENPALGAVVYDTALNTLAYCVGTTTTAGVTGTWWKITTTGATTL